MPLMHFGLNSRMFLLGLLSAITAVLPAGAQEPREQYRFVDDSQLSDEGPAFDTANQVARALRLRSDTSKSPVVNLPVWSNEATKNSPDMKNSWALIEALQEGNTAPVAFVRSSATPPTLIAWMWDVYPSNIFAGMHWRQWDPPAGAGTDITRWGMPWAGNEERPTICHWSALVRSNGPPLDFVLIDASRQSHSVGCFAAGLLKHIGNPLWWHLVLRYGGQENSDALPEVRRIFQCALKTQLNFVRGDDVPAAAVKSAEFMSAMERELRRECLINEM